MRVLRPQVEEINAKYPNQDQAMERQRQIMELYSRAGASPMSGCIPMLLQMPILIALFMFFPSAIELRHESRLLNCVMKVSCGHTTCQPTMQLLVGMHRYH